MCQIVVGSHDSILKTSGIGSCIVIAIYDPIIKIGGLAHAMLPSYKSTGMSDVVSTNGEDINEYNIKTKYADQAVSALVKELEKRGGKKQNFKASLIGGARMFKLLSADNFSIGYQNIKAARQKLKELGIIIENEETGGTIGRYMEFNLENGQISVNTKI